MENAKEVASYLNQHDAVKNVSYLGLLEPGTQQHDIYLKQCKSPGAMLAFEVEGGEHEAFQFLNHLKLIKLAVSLGSTESLAEHPASMTHAGIDPVERLAMGILPNMVRLSMGVEDAKDIIWDVEQALSSLSKPAGEMD